MCSDKSNDIFEESFRFVLPGYNVRPLELGGALGVEQVKKLPMIVRERRKNGKAFQLAMNNHPDIMIQEEIGESSWFGFSLVIRPESKLKREFLIKKLNEIGFECRPVVAGNFAKNEVVKYFNYEIHDQLKNAEHIDVNALFVGNHHYPIDEAIKLLEYLSSPKGSMGLAAPTFEHPLHGFNQSEYVLKMGKIVPDNVSIFEIGKMNMKALKIMATYDW